MCVLMCVLMYVLMSVLICALMMCALMMCALMMCVLMMCVLMCVLMCVRVLLAEDCTVQAERVPGKLVCMSPLVIMCCLCMPLQSVNTAALHIPVLGVINLLDAAPSCTETLLEAVFSRPHPLFVARADAHTSHLVAAPPQQLHLHSKPACGPSWC
jgi:hypothetical protein